MAIFHQLWSFMHKNSKIPIRYALLIQCSPATLESPQNPELHPILTVPLFPESALRQPRLLLTLHPTATPLQLITIFLWGAWQ